jgi:hypothetical protein
MLLLLFLDQIFQAGVLYRLNQIDLRLLSNRPEQLVFKKELWIYVRRLVLSRAHLQYHSAFAPSRCGQLICNSLV